MEKFELSSAPKVEDSFAKLDREISSCLTYSTGPAGMKGCLVNGMNSWDQELNKTYQALQSELASNPSAKTALTRSENEWIRFRDLEFKLIDRQYKNAPPETHPGVDVLANKLDIVETRTRELQAYRDNKVTSPGLSNPIDRKISTCLNAAADQTAQKICIGNGIEEWKSDLEHQSRLLARRFQPAYRPAQSQWARFRDAENEFIYRRFDGNEVPAQELAAHMTLLRDRAVQLSMRNSVRFK